MKDEDGFESDPIVRIHDAIDEALRDFGEYPMYDKGAMEVMDVDELIEGFTHDLPIEEVGRILVGALRHEHGAPFVSAALYLIHCMDEERWDALMAYEGGVLEKLF